MSQFPKSWEKDFYVVLEVKKSDTPDDIKKSYRRLARELHPDVNPGNAAAEERFKEISEAYEVLSDETKRREYDEYRSLRGSGHYDFVYQPPSLLRFWRSGRLGIVIAVTCMAILFPVGAYFGGAMDQPATSADQDAAVPVTTTAPTFPPAAAAKAVAKGFTPVPDDSCLIESRNQWIMLVDPDLAAGHWAPAQGKRGSWVYGGEHPGSELAYFSYDQHNNTVTAESHTHLAGLVATDTKGGKHFYRLTKDTITAPLHDPLNPDLVLVQLQFCGNS